MTVSYWCFYPVEYYPSLPLPETSSPTPPPVSPSPPPDSVIDVVSGDPMFTVPINARSGTFTPGSVSLCYEIHGEDGQFFNLISDSCLSVNAHYARPHLSLPVNVMDQIAVVATNNDGENVNISINHQCRAQVNEIDLVYFNSSGIVVLAVGSQVIVTAGNCNDEAVVMSVTCERSDIGNGDNTLITDMLRFSVYRGLALRESSHGLLGEFPLTTATVMYNYTCTASLHSPTLSISPHPPTHPPTPPHTTQANFGTSLSTSHISLETSTSYPLATETTNPPDSSLAASTTSLGNWRRKSVSMSATGRGQKRRGFTGALTTQ